MLAARVQRAISLLLHTLQHALDSRTETFSIGRHTVIIGALREGHDIEIWPWRKCGRSQQRDARGRLRPIPPGLHARQHALDGGTETFSIGRHAIVTGESHEDRTIKINRRRKCRRSQQHDARSPLRPIPLGLHASQHALDSRTQAFSIGRHAIVIGESHENHSAQIHSRRKCRRSTKREDRNLFPEADRLHRIQPRTLAALEQG
jgi:hypothetical protein